MSNKMTIEAAIIELNRLRLQERMDIDRARLGAAIDKLTEAGRRQISKKPKRENGNWNCPICGYPAIRISYQQKKYCDECGQALDWSD